jgi:alpha-N-arabinofuranosidase
MVNVIAPIFTSEDDMFLQTIYHPLKLYRDHSLEISLDVFAESPTYQTRIFNELLFGDKNAPVETIPYLDVSATMNEQASGLSLAVINRHKEESIEAEISLAGFHPERTTSVYEINGPGVDAKNTFAEPDIVCVAESEFQETADNFKYEFPAHSITLLKLKKAEA